MQLRHGIGLAAVLDSSTLYLLKPIEIPFVSKWLICVGSLVKMRTNGIGPLSFFILMVLVIGFFLFEIRFEIFYLDIGGDASYYAYESSDSLSFHFMRNPGVIFSNFGILSKIFFLECFQKCLFV